MSTNYTSIINTPTPIKLLSLFHRQGNRLREATATLSRSRSKNMTQPGCDPRWLCSSGQHSMPSTYRASAWLGCTRWATSLSCTLRRIRSTARAEASLATTDRRPGTSRAKRSKGNCHQYEKAGLPWWLHGKDLLPMQETQVRPLIWDDTTCHRTTKPMCHRYCTCALKSGSCNYWPKCCNCWSSHATETPDPQ